MSADALPDRRTSEFTHVCIDCGALGVAGGYHDHGGGNAGDTIPLSSLPIAVRSFQAIEQERDELRAENADLKLAHKREGELSDLRASQLEALKAEALEVCGSTYGMLTAGVVDDHDRIMRACNELAEFGRRLTGAAPPLSDLRPASDEIDLTTPEEGK